VNQPRSSMNLKTHPFRPHRVPSPGAARSTRTPPWSYFSSSTSSESPTPMTFIYHQQNRRLGAVAGVGENLTKAPTRILTVNTDSLFTRRLEIRDQSGECVLTVTRPRKLFKNVLRVSGPSGELLGNAVQEGLWGKKRFSFVVSGQRVGGMDGDSMIVPRAWSIRDEAGTEVATVQKRFLLTRPKPLPEPLASMALACGLTIDLILAGKQLPPFLTLMTGTPG
jgi:hypothetical protein